VLEKATLTTPRPSARKFWRTLTESGNPAAEAEGVTFRGIQDGAAVFSVESGTYTFVAR
jgi:hypothetical protein